MSLLSVTREVCAAVGVLVPGAIFSQLTGNRTLQEMLALANEMAQRIAYDTRDWTRLRTNATFAGNGALDVDGVTVVGTSAFDLPENYKRMLLTSNVWRSTSQQQPMRFISDTDQWLNRRVASASNSAWGEWTLLGGQIHIWPIMYVGTFAYFAYLNKDCVALAGGGFGDTFMSDSDAFVLDERLLKLGMIWQWKASKGSPYAEDMGTYSDALANMMGRDSPSPILAGRTPVPGGVYAGY